MRLIKQAERPVQKIEYNCMSSARVASLTYETHVAANFLSISFNDFSQSQEKF